METTKKQKLVVYSLIIFLTILVLGFFISAIYIHNLESKPEEPYTIKKTFINYTCSDGRMGFASLEDWAEIKIPYDGCYGNYGHQCLNSNIIRWNEK